MATANELVRKYLNSVGVKDDQIGYDNKRNQVTVGGNDFYQPVKVENGVSYGDTAGLNSAWNTYQQRQGQKTSSDLFNQVSGALTKPWEPEAFSYTPETDPSYQAALRTAQSNAKVATGNAIAGLNARGIDTSTVASDRAAQIEQQSLGNVTDTVLPQLMSQAYNKWATEQGLKQNAQTNWINGLASLLNNQDNRNQNLFNNNIATENAALNKKIANDNAAQGWSAVSGRLLSPQEDWSGLLRQIQNGTAPLSLAGQAAADQKAQQDFNNQLATKQYDEGVRQFGLNYDLQKDGQTNSQNNASFNNDRNTSNDAYNRFVEMWKLTDSAPADYPEYGIKKGDKFPVSSTSGNQASAYDSTVKNIDSMANYQKDFKGNNNLTNAGDVEKAILQSGLSEYEMWQLYNRYGIPWQGDVPKKATTGN